MDHQVIEKKTQKQDRLPELKLGIKYPGLL